MFRLVVSMVAMLISALSCAAYADVRPSILVLGDSLSAGYGISRQASWPSLLTRRLREQGYRHSVINASISGETTAGGARRLDALLSEHEPSVLILALGANDGLRGIDIREIEKNLSHMISVAASSKAQVVLLKVRIPPNYGPRYTASFEAVFDQLGARPEVIYAPFMLAAFATDPSAFQSDGLHPTAAAQQPILETLWPSIAQALERPSVEAMLH